MPLTDEQRQAFLGNASPSTITDERRMAFLNESTSDTLPSLDVEQTTTAEPKRAQSLGEIIANIRPAPLGPPLKEYPRVAANVASFITGRTVPPESFLGGQSFANKFPPVESFGGKATQLAGEAMTFPTSASGRAYGATQQAMNQIPLLARNALGRGVGRAASGAMAGLAYDLPNLQGAPSRMAQVAVANVVLPPIVEKMLKRTSSKTLLTDPQIERLAKDVRQATFGAKTAEGIEFDDIIAQAVAKNPKAPSPAIDLVGKIEALMRENPDVASKIQQGLYRSGLSGNTTLQKMLTDRNLAMNATATQIQEIKQTLQAIPSVSRALTRSTQASLRPGSFKASVSDADLEVLDLINSTRSTLLSAYPETQSAYQRFAGFMEDYRTILPSLRKSSMEKTLLRGLGTAEQREAMKRVLPSEILDLIERTRTQHQGASEALRKNEAFKKTLKRLGLDAAKVIGVGEVYRRVHDTLTGQ